MWRQLILEDRKLVLANVTKIRHRGDKHEGKSVCKWDDHNLFYIDDYHSYSNRYIIDGFVEVNISTLAPIAHLSKNEEEGIRVGQKWKRKNEVGSYEIIGPSNTNGWFRVKILEGERANLESTTNIEWLRENCTLLSETNQEVEPNSLSSNIIEKCSTCGHTKEGNEYCFNSFHLPSKTVESTLEPLAFSKFYRTNKGALLQLIKRELKSSRLEILLLGQGQLHKTFYSEENFRKDCTLHLRTSEEIIEWQSAQYGKNRHLDIKQCLIRMG